MVRERHDFFPGHLAILQLFTFWSAGQAGRVEFSPVCFCKQELPTSETQQLAGRLSIIPIFNHKCCCCDPQFQLQMGCAIQKQRTMRLLSQMAGRNVEEWAATQLQTTFLEKSSTIKRTTAAGNGFGFLNSTVEVVQQSQGKCLSQQKPKSTFSLLRQCTFQKRNSNYIPPSKSFSAENF